MGAFICAHFLIICIVKKFCDVHKEKKTMLGFQTASSTYYLDLVNNYMWGGKLGDTKHRIAPGSQFIIGAPGLAYFVDDYGNQLYTSDGRPAMIKTGIIKNYI